MLYGLLDEKATPNLHCQSGVCTSDGYCSLAEWSEAGKTVANIFIIDHNI